MKRYCWLRTLELSDSLRPVSDHIDALRIKYGRMHLANLEVAEERIVQNINTGGLKRPLLMMDLCAVEPSFGALAIKAVSLSGPNLERAFSEFLAVIRLVTG